LRLVLWEKAELRVAQTMEMAIAMMDFLMD
jgi:hypothetical protein